MAALVDASLVGAEMVAVGVVRFSMLELIREYALARLHEAGEEQCQCRHAAYYARLAGIVAAHFGPEQGVRDAQFDLEQELPNARAALQWAEERHEAELGLRLTGFTRLWHVRGQMNEAEHWLERMLALDLQAREQGKPTAPLTIRIEKLYGLGRTMVRHGKAEQGAEAFSQEALQLAQRICDLHGISSAFATLGMIAQATRLSAAASTLREQAQIPLPPVEREAFEHTVAPAKTALNEPVFAEEWTIGAAFTQDEAIDYALSDACE